MPDRTPFRRRLALALGVGIGAALALVGVVAWLGASVLATHQIRSALRAEALSIEMDIQNAGGAIDTDPRIWQEPHHRFIAPRIDPYFVQIFDNDGQLVSRSPNVGELPGYPQRVLPSTVATGLLSPLATLDAGGRRLHRITEPLQTASGETIGTLQIARYDAGLQAQLGRLAAGLAVGLSALLAGLIGLVWWVGGRVVRPLQRITRHAQALSPTTLGDRIPIPDDADRDTAALAAALNTSLVRLDASFEEMQRFTANAAHELQTPLTILRGHVDVALRRDRSAEDYRQTLRLLGDEVDMLARTTAGLLALARLDTLADGPATDRLDLAEVASSVAESLRPQAEREGLRLIVEAQETPVHGHEGLLRDAVRNLLDNAVKYTEAGAVRLRVWPHGDAARLAVVDSGRGIDAEMADHATDRFWRADDVQHLPGSGLGLALVRRIVEHHGGRLNIEPEAAGGTRVDVEIPARSTDA